MFDLNNDNNFETIEVWSEVRGRKSDTYIYGWNLDETMLKEHLKNIKKKRGCNGSMKELIKETGPIKVMHLQGNVKDFIIQYLQENGISESNIKIKL